MRKMVKGPLHAVLAAGAIAVLVAGCNSGGGNNASSGGNSSNNSAASATPLHTVQLVADTAKRANSATATITANVTSNGVSAVIAGTLSIQVRPTLYENANFTQFHEGSMSLPGGMQEVLTPNAAYVRMSLLSQMVHKPWVEIPYASLAQSSGIDLRPLIQQAENDSPLMQTQLLAGATNVKKVGTAVLNGTTVTEYTGSYPVSASLKYLPASDRARLQQVLSTAGFGTAQFDVWVDSSMQAHKVIVNMHGTSITETVTMVLSSINQPVTQYIPPASQVASLPHGA